MSDDNQWLKRLDDILDRIDDIEEIFHAMTPSKFAESKMAIAALERHISVIGEAVNFIPDAVKAKFPQSPWRDIYSMRNFLVHGYDSVKPEVIWDTAQSDMAPLKKTILAIKSEYMKKP